MNNEQEIVNSHPAPFHFDRKRMIQNSIYVGISTALFMTAYFATVKLFFAHVPTALHYAQYLLIFGFINRFLIAQKHNTGYEEPFVPKNFIIGAITSIITAVAFLVLQVLTFELIPGATVYESTDAQAGMGTTPFMVFALTAVETFIFGMLSTFIAFQYLQRPFTLSRTIN